RASLVTMSRRVRSCTRTRAATRAAITPRYARTSPSSEQPLRSHRNERFSLAEIVERPEERQLAWREHRAEKRQPIDQVVVDRLRGKRRRRRETEHLVQPGH